MMIPVELKKPAVVIELKCVKNIKQMEEGCDRALEQIEDRHYTDEVIEEGCTHILKYGICFYKKLCMVKCREERIEI